MIDRLILASASPARLHTLQRAGVAVSVHVSHVDESGLTASTTDELVTELARLKGEAVLATLPDNDLALIACDSLLDLDGQPIGKPATPRAAVEIWGRLRGRSAQLITGHHLVVRRDGRVKTTSASVCTEVTFADVSDAEIAAYVASGEPMYVAGAFTIDGRGGPYVSRLSGDPHNVVGISLPWLRIELAKSGVAWHDLWAAPAAE